MRKLWQLMVQHLLGQVSGVGLELIQQKLNFGLMVKLDCTIGLGGHVIQTKIIGQLIG